MSALSLSMVCRRLKRPFARDDIFGSTSCETFLVSGGTTSMGVNTSANLALRSSQRSRSSFVAPDNMLNWLSMVFVSGFWGTFCVCVF